MIVILSSERSGSTLLRVLLGKNSQVVAPSELWLFHYETYGQWRSGYPAAIDSVLELLRSVGRGMSEDEVEERCAGMSTPKVYRWLLSFLPQDMYLVDKTPGYANEMATLLRSACLSPSYIWLIRHPLGVVASHVALMRDRRESDWSAFQHVRYRLWQCLTRLRHGGMSREAKDREALWRKQNRTIRSFLEDRNSNSYAVVHFEDLVAQPEAELRRLAEGFGFAFERAMLDPSVARSIKPGIGDPNYGRYSEINQQAAFKWAERYTEGQLDLETRELMRDLGTRSPV